MIEIKNLDKSFGDRQILFDINATFETGKVNQIMVPCFLMVITSPKWIELNEKI
jgi:ABC-type arginine transport system ATPase subunit